MIALLLLWLALLPVLAALGGVGLRAVAAAPTADPVDAVFEAVWIGLVVAAAALLLAGAVGPLGDWALLALLLAGAIAMPHTARQLGSLRRAFPLIAAACVLAAWLAAGRVVYFDTAYYHLQAVRMMQSFGVLQGAHLVAEVYGSVSSWFALLAPFSTGSLAVRGGAGVVNGLAVAVAIAQASISFRRLLQDRGTAADVLICVALAVSLGLALRWHMVAAATPDLPLLFLPPVLGWMLMRRPAGDRAPLLLAAGAASIKLSAAPLVLIAMAWSLWRLPRPLSRLTGCVALGLPFATATAVAFVLASGCVVFPVAATCLDVAWGMSPERVAEFAHRVATGAGTGGGAHAAAAGIQSPVDRLLFWMRRDTSSAALGLAYVGTVAALLPAWRRPAMEGLRWPLLLGVAGGLYVGLTAPVGRFAGGYVALTLGVAAVCLWRLPAVGAVIAAMPSRSRLAAGIAGLTGSVLLIGLARATAPLAHEAVRVEMAIAAGVLPADPERSRLLRPLAVVPYVLNEANPALPVRYRTTQRDGVTFVQPEGDGACWAHEPPCGAAARLVDPSRGLRGGLIGER